MAQLPPLEIVPNRSNIRLLNILDNLTLISEVYQQITDIDEDEFFETAKNTKVTLNNIDFSYYYLMKRKFHYINKNNIKIKVNFNMKKVTNKTYFTLKILVMSGKSQCNKFRCRDYYCIENFHYFHKKTDELYMFKSEDVNDILVELEKKIHDFINCDVCLKIWNMNTQDKQPEIDIEHSHICDNCVFSNYLNKKTLENIGDCSICLKKMYCNNTVRTECEHTYHRICLETWLKDKDTCPLCRTNLL